jgi:glutamate racemase
MGSSPTKPTTVEYSVEVQMTATFSWPVHSSSSSPAQPSDLPSAPIGVFDSGVGGISVLKRLVVHLPHEHFDFFGDSANAPYGTRPAQQVRDLSEAIVNHFMDMGVKAIVIACNTATSAAAQTLRVEHPDMPIIGIEPAVKPAVEHARQVGGDVVVMATQLTLAEKKFADLLHRVQGSVPVHKVPAPQLVELVEAGKTDTPETEQYLRSLLNPYLPTMSSLVLGCTHYPFAKPLFRRIVGPSVQIIDGSDGVARELDRQLRARSLSAPDSQTGSVRFANSAPGDTQIKLSERLFAMDLGR